MTRLTTYPHVVRTGYQTKPLCTNTQCVNTQIDPEVEVLAAAALVAGATPVVVGAAGAAPAVVAEDPIHAILRTCDETLLAARMISINVEGLDSLSAFSQLNGDSDVSEMLKRMAARPTAAGREIDSRHPTHSRWENQVVVKIDSFAKVLGTLFPSLLFPAMSSLPRLVQQQLNNERSVHPDVVVIQDRIGLVGGNSVVHHYFWRRARPPETTNLLLSWWIFILQNSRFYRCSHPPCWH